MKNILTIMFILFLSSQVKSQNNDAINVIQKLTLENDSLKKKITNLYNDSIIYLRNSIRKNDESIDRLQKERIQIDSELKIRKDKIASLEYSKINIENNSLKIKVDSLSILFNEQQKNLELKNTKISENKVLYEQEMSKLAESIKNEIKTQLAKYYDMPFDKLVMSLNIEILNRDKEIIGNDPKFSQLYSDLQKFYRANKVLSEVFNEQNVNSNLLQLENIEQTELVKKLKGNISKYKINRDALKETLNNIQEIDKKTTAVDEFSKSKKLGFIMYEFSSFIYNYRFNFDDYPYLADIVLNIINKKQKDANADISDFIIKL